jgi:RNA polymerase sigma-70 factor (ECF subfamily)
MLPEGLPDRGSGPEEEAIKNETYGLLGRIFRLLDENYRTVLYLQEFEGLSYEEIARIMGLTHGQVRMLLYRGRKKFRKLAEKEMKGI